MGKLFISVWKIDTNQDYFDIRLVLMPEKSSIRAVYELKGVCKNLDGRNLVIKELSIHSAQSLAVVVQYILQQINNDFAFNKDIDEDGDGMREWISPMDSGDKRLFIRSVFESKMKTAVYS